MKMQCINCRKILSKSEMENGKCSSCGLAYLGKSKRFSYIFSMNGTEKKEILAIVEAKQNKAWEESQKKAAEERRRQEIETQNLHAHVKKMMEEKEAKERAEKEAEERRRQEIETQNLRAHAKKMMEEKEAKERAEKEAKEKAEKKAKDNAEKAVQKLYQTISDDIKTMKPLYHEYEQKHESNQAICENISCYAEVLKGNGTLRLSNQETSLNERREKWALVSELYRASYLSDDSFRELVWLNPDPHEMDFFAIQSLAKKALSQVNDLRMLISEIKEGIEIEDKIPSIEQRLKEQLDEQNRQAQETVRRQRAEEQYEKAFWKKDRCLIALVLVMILATVVGTISAFMGWGKVYFATEIILPLSGLGFAILARMWKNLRAVPGDNSTISANDRAQIISTVFSAICFLAELVSFIGVFIPGLSKYRYLDSWRMTFFLVTTYLFLEVFYIGLTYNYWGYILASIVVGLFVLFYGFRPVYDKAHDGETINYTFIYSYQHYGYTFDDGCSYKGEWRNRQFNGYGVYTDADGNTKSGIWKDGKLVE